ncbi:MAG TPA: alpha-amylase family glycosyl hydrolase, partial [Verrucomicrobiota bacterium]|nr:alpha-amylase family glycosyl hydrolase [Verrucomicrobiota bacterium]
MKTLPSAFRRAAVALLALLFIGVAPLDSVANSTNSVVRQSPDWLKSAVVYEIFPRNFSVEGTFNAITARLDELKDLGVDILWLMPIHPVGQINKKGSIGSPYAVRDYYAVNPDYGTPDDLKKLIAAAHQRGMKVILDIVAGHTAWDSVLVKQHPEFYKKDADGKIIPPNPDWSDVAALDYENPALRSYMIEMLKHWLKEYQVDGFRCDVAFTVPIEFWENAREQLEAVHPEMIMLADATASPKLLAKAFNMDNSGAMNSALNRVMSGIAPAYHLKLSWETTLNQFPAGSLHLRFTDNHENVRWISRFGAPGALAAQVLMLTLDGVPLFYNGMEVGDSTDSADPALFEKLPIYWTPPGRPALRSIYRNLIQLRKEHAAFRNEQVAWLQNTASADVASFTRKDDKNEFL